MENKNDELKNLKSKLVTRWIILAVMLIDLVALIICWPHKQKLAGLVVFLVVIYVIASLSVAINFAPVFSKYMGFEGLNNTGAAGCIMAPLYIISAIILGLVGMIIGPFVVLYEINKTHAELKSLKNK